MTSLLPELQANAFSREQAPVLFQRIPTAVLTGLTGGGALNLDGVDVSNFSVGQSFKVYISGTVYDYVLTTSAAAESSPAVIAPDTGGTGVRWILQTAVAGTGLFGDGTAANPSISFSSDSDTGFFKEGTANEFSIAIGGSTAFRFSGSSIFGISGTSAKAELQLATSGAISLTSYGTNQNITLTPSGSGSVYAVQSSSQAATNSYGLRTGISGTGNDTSFGNHTSYGWIQSFNGRPLSINSLGNSVLIGTVTNSGNGVLQLATHTTSAGGIGFGTDLTLSRISAGSMALGGTTPILSLVDGGVSRLALQAYSDNHAYISATTGSLIFRSNGTTTALTLDSSQRTILSGALRLANAYVAGAVVGTGSLTIQDSAGTTYRIPCLV